MKVNTAPLHTMLLSTCYANLMVLITQRHSEGERELFFLLHLVSAVERFHIHLRQFCVCVRPKTFPNKLQTTDKRVSVTTKLAKQVVWDLVITFFPSSSVAPFTTLFQTRCNKFISNWKFDTAWEKPNQTHCKFIWFAPKLDVFFFVLGSKICCTRLVF